MNILITGHSRGLGAALAAAHLAAGDSVYGVARSAGSAGDSGLREVSCDLATDGAGAILSSLVAPDVPLECVYLNAGVLGPIAPMRAVSRETLESVMAINVWAAKQVLDWLIGRPLAPARVVALSSGAATSGNYGWGPYALSKAALNMLVRLYAQEMPDTHIVALAPGYVDTAMQAQIRAASATEFPSLQRLQDAVGTTAMQSPATAAAAIIDALPRLAQEPSGSYVDLRHL